MLNAINANQSAGAAVASREPGTNITTKLDLLNRAKSAIEAGEHSLREAADALGLAEEDHAATQREMAEVVCKSASWVNKLLKWRRSGYKDHSPFGPTTKRGRVEHADTGPRWLDYPREVLGPRSGQNAPRPVQKNATDKIPSSENRSQSESSSLRPRKASPEEAKANLRYAIDHWWPQLDDAGKSEMKAYLLKTVGVMT